MGISGLLPFLKDATTTVNIKQFEGSTVAVDTYCWIYKGAFSCAEDLALGTAGADGHVKFVLKYVHKLLEWGIKPIMVLDGSCLPSKKGTEAKRRESKEIYRKKAAQCLAEGRRNEARECFQRCIDCTPKMALDVIKALHIIGVDVLVAPYEADAQLAYLSKINVAQIVITEDSDLIPFGCEKIIYKLDMNGNGNLVQKEKIISITQFDSADNFERFRWMCILSGCDYLENLPGIGLGKAKKLLKTIQKSEIEYIIKQMPKTLKMPSLPITPQYIESFIKADKTFKYQIVFDPLQKKLVSCSKYGDEMQLNEDVSYAGIFYDDKKALEHSLGNIDVNTREIVNNFDPKKWNYKPPYKFQSNTPAHMRSIWSNNYNPYNSSNPFTKSLTTKYPNKVARPNTLCITETLTTSINLANKSKRKFESIDENLPSSNSPYKSLASSATNSDYATDSNENVLERGNKKSKNEVAKALKEEIDNFFGGYASNKASYLSSPSQNETDKSPILNKNSQKRANLLADKAILQYQMNTETSPICNYRSNYFSESSEPLTEKRNSIGSMLDKYSVNKSIKKFTYNSSTTVVLNTPENSNNYRMTELNSNSKEPFKMEKESDVIKTLIKEIPLQKKLFQDNLDLDVIKPNKLNTPIIAKNDSNIKEFLAIFKQDPSKNKLPRTRIKK